MKSGRRYLISIVASVGFLGSLPDAICEAADGAAGERGVKNPFFVLNNGTKDAKHTTAESQAAMAKELGYAGIAYSGAEGLPEMVAALDRHKLELFAVYLPANIDSGEPKYDPQLKKIVRLLKGRETVVWIYVRSKKLKPSTVEGDARAVEIIREIADLAQASGLRVSLYPHVWFWLERVEDAVRLAKKVDRKNVGVTFNLCHWLILDDEKTLKSRLELAKPYLSVVTINGTSRDVSVSSRDGWIQTLDRGTYDVYKFLETLNATGYTGPVGLQCWSIKGDAHDNLMRSMAAWRGFSSRLAAE